MNKYKDIGLKLTPQRIAILEFLDCNCSHPTADDIYADIQIKFPTMSFATVYKTLESLKEKGCLQELTIDKERKHFDPDTTRHHHLICITCKKIVDIYKEFPIEMTIEDQNNFEVLDTNIEFYGICPVCKKRRR